MILNYLNRLPVIRCTLISIVLALLFGCSDSKYKPEVNPQPKYFITLSGSVDSKLLRGFKLKILYDYQTTNKKCEEDPSSFEGAYAPRFIRHIFNIKPSANGKLQQKIPTDYYSKGFCNWRIVAFAMKSNSIGTDLIFFNPKKNAPKNDHAVLNISCKNIDNCKYTRIKRYSNFLSPKKDYTLTINFTKRKTQ